VSRSGLALLGLAAAPPGAGARISLQVLSLHESPWLNCMNTRCLRLCLPIRRPKGADLPANNRSHHYTDDGYHRVSFLEDLCSVVHGMAYSTLGKCGGDRTGQLSLACKTAGCKGACAQGSL
jgi:hypothetical protein